MRSSSKLAVGLAFLATLTVVDSALAYYNPRTGRFLSRDPIGEPGAMLVRRVAGASTGSFIPRDKVADQMHLYRYVRNTPSNLVDPLGLQESQPTSQPCCVCGPDITDALQRLLADVDSKFAGLNAQQKDDLCDGYIDAAHWDTDLFTRASTFRTEGCPKGDACEFDNKVPGVKGGASVTVDGKCFASYDVNYVLYGRMMKNCGVWNQSKANFWFIIYKTPWWTSHSWTRWTQAALWKDYGLFGGVVEPESPDNLKSCQPCGEEYDKPIHWYVYGDNNVSIRG
ncbi:MAG: hypothetical protein KKB50_02970 [Planctomycetes bacterium]|nr:hypothetical protein [Planctomycetota bacterium]